MVNKNYVIRVTRNTENEIQYIKATYNPIMCGKFSGRVIEAIINLANEDLFIEDMVERGAQAFFVDGQQINLSLYNKNAKDNKIIFQITTNIPLSLSTSYSNVFPNYSGVPIPLDTTGYKKMGMVLLWNKNGGGGVHTIKLSECNSDGTLVTPEKILREYPITVGGYLVDFNYSIPQDFIDFKGLVKLMAKSSIANGPIFDGLWLYMIRR